MHPDFEKNGYYVARNFFDTTTVKLMSTYFDIKRRLINAGLSVDSITNRPTSTKHGEVADSYMFYGDVLTESILFNSGQSICNTLGINLYPTYTCARLYTKGSTLIPHTDRESCEISVTSPVLLSGSNPSVIYISNFTIGVDFKAYTQDEVMATENYTRIELYPGDALFYKGCEHYHWRLPLEEDYLIQFFMHFVRKDGLYTEHALDKREYIGFPPNRQPIQI